MNSRFFLLILISLVFVTKVRASFSLSGSSIIQTGTNTNLSGLSGVSGVTTQSINDKTIYILNNRQLIIRGTLTIDPEIEELLINGSGTNSELIRVEQSGHLILGKAIVKNGYTRYSEGMAIYLENTVSGFTNRVSFYNQSSLTWNGGVVSIYAGKFGFYTDNVTVRINSKNAKLVYRTTDPQNQIRQETDDFISDGFTLINGDFTIVGTDQQLNGYDAIQCSGSLAFSSATPNIDVPIRNYSGGNKGNDIDVKLWAGCRPLLINPEFGSQLNVGSHISGNNTSYGVVRVYKEIQVYTKSNTNAPVSGIRYYIEDYNNGQRETYTRESPSVDLTGDILYSGYTTTTGYSSVFQVLLASNIANNGNSDNPNVGNYTWDYRSKNNNNEDLYDIHLLGYNHILQQLPDVELKGVDTTTITATMINDENISKATLAEAQAVQGISITHNASNNTGVINITDTVSLCDLYDFVKADKITTNYTEPTLLTTCTQANGTTLSTENYQINISVSGRLITCDKYSKITSQVSSNLADVNDNLGVSFVSSNETRKVIILENLDSAHINIYDKVSNTLVKSDSNIVGTYTYITSGSSNLYDVLITKDGYSNWSVNIDMSSEDFIRYFVVQSELGTSPILVEQATLENQETLLFLSQKLVQKSENIQKTLAETPQNNTTITINGSANTTSATLGKQEENLELLKLLLSKTTAIKKTIKE